MDDRPMGTHQTGTLQTRVALLNAALDGLSCGLSVWSTDLRLMLWNQPFLAIYNLGPDAVMEGATLAEVAERIIAAGNHPDRSASQLYGLYRDGLSSDAEYATVSVDERLS